MKKAIEDENANLKQAQIRLVWPNLCRVCIKFVQSKKNISKFWGKILLCVFPHAHRNQIGVKKSKISPKKNLINFVAIK